MNQPGKHYAVGTLKPSVDCRHCGLAFAPHRADVRVCPSCKYVPATECADCGEPYDGKGGTVALCARHRERRQRVRNRKKNLKRLGVHVTDVFDVFDVGERDGWICHLCEQPVDPDISGILSAGPTIDHIIPVSLGGRDCLSNVALAHKGCNCRRGNNPIAA